MFDVVEFLESNGVNNFSVRYFDNTVFVHKGADFKKLFPNTPINTVAQNYKGWNYILGDPDNRLRGELISE